MAKLFEEFPPRLLCAACDTAENSLQHVHCCKISFCATNKVCLFRVGRSSPYLPHEQLRRHWSEHERRDTEVANAFLKGVSFSLCTGLTIPCIPIRFTNSIPLSVPLPLWQGAFACAATAFEPFLSFRATIRVPRCIKRKHAPDGSSAAWGALRANAGARQGEAPPPGGQPGADGGVDLRHQGLHPGRLRKRGAPPPPGPSWLTPLQPSRPGGGA